MANVYFLKIDGIPGESADNRHQGEIEVQSFTWGAVQPLQPGTGTGAAVGKLQVQGFQFVKRLDRSSPALMRGCATGKHFPTAVLTARKASEGQQEYLKFTFKEVLITSYHVNGSGETDNVPIDQVSLGFNRLEMSYRVQKPDGTLGEEVKEEFSVTATRNAG